jgi:hypothetical protein
MPKLFIVGFPSYYGGAGAELHHQIHLWKKAFPEIELNIIPTQQGFSREPLYQEMLNLDIQIHEPLYFGGITKDDAVINFCSGAFLENVEKIYEQTKRTVFVNCMTWLHKLEKEKAHKNNISFYLYQRPQIRDDHAELLRQRGSTAEFLHFIPYFEQEGWEFSVKDQEYTNIGRISRADQDKFAKSTLHIYEYITSPKFKRGHFLGFDDKSAQKTGKPYEWIKTYKNQHELPVKSFYDKVDFIVQPTDTTENWPRIGFEAMYSGKPLIVDDRGGWQYMIDHGHTGFLCNTPKEFIYWGTRLAFEPDLRHYIARNALKKAQELSSFEASKESWKKVFEKVYA